MGIDYSGGMVVGCRGKDIKNQIPEEYGEDIVQWLCEDEGMDRYSPHYDADSNYCVFGFPVGDIPVEDINDSWVMSLKTLAIRFQDITGTKATLYGCQDIY